MRVFVTGGTGVLGQRLLPILKERGHDVVALTRRHDKDALVAKLGGKPARASLFDVEALTKAASGCDVLVHAATLIPRSARPKESDWRENDRIRVEGTQNVAAAARAAGAQRVVFQSVAWLARPESGGAFDERAPPNPDRATRSALTGEEILREVAKDGSLEATVLRCGSFYGPESAQTRMLGELLAKRRLPVVGQGDARWSMLHVHDTATAFADAVEMSASGTYHVVDNEPVRVADFLDGFAQRLEAPRPMRVPKWLATLAAGPFATRWMTRGFETDAKRFRSATGWEPRYATWREGLDDVVAAWRREGWPTRS